MIPATNHENFFAMNASERALELVNAAESKFDAGKNEVTYQQLNITPAADGGRKGSSLSAKLSLWLLKTRS